MTVPSVEALLGDVLEAVMAKPPGDRAEIVRRVATSLGVATSDTKSSEATRVVKALKCLQAAGLVTKRGQTWHVTFAGKLAADFGASVDVNFLRSFASFRTFEAGMRSKAARGRSRALDLLPGEDRRKLQDAPLDRTIYAVKDTHTVRGGLPGTAKRS